MYKVKSYPIINKDTYFKRRIFMNLITLENISKNYSEKKLLDNISLGINEGDKIGVIGINGTGKSTFLKIIAGVEHCDSGNIIKGNKVRIEYLSQNPEYDFEATVLEQVFKGNSQEMKLLREYEDVLERVNEGEDLSDRFISIQSKIDTMALWDLESEAKTILTKLGISDFKAKIGDLSGGQRKRISLASALITPSELLVLDEPTNHMDSETITWLEGYLNNRKGAFIMITHDRYFLDRVANRIIEIYDGSLYSYEGNYSLFVEKKAEREADEIATQKKKESLFRKELAWIKRGAKARSTKQKARIDRFEDLKDSMGYKSQENVELSVQGSRLGNKVIEMDHVEKSFDGQKYIDDFSYILLRDDRIGIVGPNGIGKSTLMNIISGEIKADSGTIDIGDTVKIGYFSQETYHMDEDMRVIDYVKEIAEYLPLANGDRITASQMLEKFLFTGSMQYTYIGKLSGGERRRLYLLRVLMGAPNVLLLDEPTNDLDIATLTILEDFLDDFNGPVITVSHDRYFLDRVCNKIFAYEGNGIIERYNGNYGDYLSTVEEKNLSTIVDKAPKKEKPQPKNEERKQKQLKFSYKEQKEFDEIDEVIESLENKIQELDEAIDRYSSDFGKLQDLLSEKEATEAKLEEKYDRWTYLNELNEEIQRNKNMK